MAIRVIKFKQEYTNGKSVDMVLIAPIGEGHQKTQTWHRVEQLRPPEGIDESKRNADTYVAMNARWSIIGPAYEAWLSNSEIPETGTPLAAWSGVTSDQASLLKGMGLKTVEDVQAISGDSLARLPFPNARKLPELAASFLEGADAAAKDARIAEMEERMAAMTEMLEAQTAPAKRSKKTEEAA